MRFPTSILATSKKQAVQLFGLGTGVFATLAWALSPIFGKLLLQHLTPFTLLAIGSVTSVLLVFLFFGFFPELKKLKQLPLSKILYLSSIGILSSVIAPLAFLWGLKNTNASDATLLANSEPIFMAIFGAMFLSEKLHWQHVGGKILMLFGITFIATKGFTVGISLEGGAIFILFSGFIHAISNTIFKKNLSHISPEIVIFIRNLIGSIVLLSIIPFLFEFTHDFSALQNKNVLIFLLAYVGLCIFLAQLLWYKSLDIISSSTSGNILLLYPIFGVFFSWLILDESLFFYHLFGGVFIFAGLIIGLIHRKKQNHFHLLHKLKHFFHH